MRAQLDAEITLRRGCGVLAVIGDLDQATAARYEALVAGIVRVPGVERVELDCRALEFVDAAGLHALLRSRVVAWSAGVEWFVGPTSTALRRVLDLVGVGSLHDASMN